MDEIEDMVYASTFTIPEHQQAQIERKFCFSFTHVTLSTALFMEGHVILTLINQKTIATLVKEDLANALLYSENTEIIYS